MADIGFDVVVEKLLRTQEGVEIATKLALTKSATEVHKTATKKFGTYQGAIGPYNAWAVLNPETITQKLKAGSKGDDPLIGHSLYGRDVYPTPLRQSLTMNIKSMTAEVGTNDPIGQWQEFGTIHIPPRPFLRPALYQNEDKIREIFSAAVAEGLLSVFK